MRSRRLLIIVGLVAVLAVVAGGLERVRAALHDDDRFVNGQTAGSTLADASQWLLDDAGACESKRGAHDPRCNARLSAAAFTGVAAAGVLSCTAPGVYRARTSLVAYIDALESFDQHRLGTTRAPSPPPVPAC